MLSLILVLLDEVEAERFTVLYQQTQKAALQVAYAILKNSHDAEEAVQEAFIRVAHHMENIDDPLSDRAKHYVLKIAKYRALTFYERREQRAEEGLGDHVEQMVDYLSPEEHWLSEEQYRLLVTCIRRMCEPYQTVLYFHLVEYMETKEIAVLLDKKLKTIQQQIFRGRQFLREIIMKEVLQDGREKVQVG